MSLPLPDLFAKALRAAAKANDLPTIEDETQDLVQLSKSDLLTLSSRIDSLSLFSPNETLEDLSTRDMIYLCVPYVLSQVQGRVKAFERDQRLTSLTEAQRLLRIFMDSLESYEIVPVEERELYAKQPSVVIDPARRRELKIKQYQKEKEIRTRIAILQKRRNLPSSIVGSSDYDLILGLLPASKSTDNEDCDSGSESETMDILREATLLLLRLAYAQAHSQLESIELELALLRTAPPSPTESLREHNDDRRKGKSKEQEDVWKIDTPSHANGNGPLLDSSGKPLQPFTILPAGVSERIRFQAQVFGPGHRLPTMTVDEYLQIEQERGNIISGGGPAAEHEPTSSEQLVIDAEQDGSLAGDNAAERMRLKNESWAQFTDANPRGAGNTMNRG